MKKLLFLISIIALFSLGLQAQTRIGVTKGSAAPWVYTGSVSAPNWVYIGGQTADTLVNKDTLVWAIRVNGSYVQKLSGRLKIVRSSGTVSDTTYFYGSHDGTTKDCAIDSIFTTSATGTTYKYLTDSRWTAFNYPYILIWNWKKGGAALKSTRTFEFILRNN
jgi:hypothetical protein